MILPTQREQVMIHLYQSGLTGKECANAVGYSDYKRCYRLLKKMNIKSKNSSECHRKYEADDNFFEKIDTEEKAYWLGFITADGCLTGKTLVYLQLKHSDINHLEKFKCAIKATNPIHYQLRKKYGKEYELSYIHINSPKMFNDLVKLGVTSRKSFSVSPCKKVPKSLLRHYWRGLIDGDGCLMSGKSKNINLVGNYKIVNGFSKYILNNIGSRQKISPKQNIYSIRYGKTKKLFEIVKLLYKECNISLDRKKLLADKLIKELS